MKYWPMTVIIQSPLVPPAYAWELQQFYRKIPSEGAYDAVFDVARKTPPVEAPNTVVVSSVGSPCRRVCLGYPTEAEWLPLERAAVVAGDNGYLYVLMDALH